MQRPIMTGSYFASSRAWSPAARSAASTTSPSWLIRPSLRLPRIGRQRDELALDAELGADCVLGQHALLAEADGRAEVALRQLELAEEAAEVAPAERFVEWPLQRPERVAAQELQGKAGRDLR